MHKISAKSRFFLGIIVSTSLLPTACKPSGSESQTLGNIAEGSDYLWPNAQANVCWEFDIRAEKIAEFAPMRQKVQTFVTQEMAKAGFTLSGWGKCEGGSRGMRVAQWIPKEPVPENPDGEAAGMVQAFGRRVDGHFRGIGFYMSEPECASSDVCVLATALHEFGHAIGLKHEANRRDSVCALDQTLGFGDVDSGSLPHGQYDRDSIMNYCRAILSRRSGLPIGLSSGDIATIKSLYSGKPQFPREEACRKDGYSWVSGNDISCCTVPPNTKFSTQPAYPICPQTMDSQAKPDSSKEPEVSIDRERLWQGATVEAKASPPVNTGVAILSCHEGQYPFTTSANQNSPVIFSFRLHRATALQDNTFTCTHIDAYERNGSDLGIQNSKKMARYTFPQPLKISPSLKATQLNLEGVQWQTFSVANGVTTAPSISAPQKNNVDTVTNAPLEALQKQKNVTLVIEDVPMTSKVFAASMTCNVGQISASSQATATIVKEGKRGFILLFLIPVASQGGNIQCTDLKWMTEGQNGQSTNSTKKMHVKFQQPLAFAMDEKPVFKSFTAPVCGAGSPPSPATSAMATGVGSGSNPNSNRAPNATTSQPGPAGMIPSGVQAAAPAARPVVPQTPAPQSTNGCNYDKAAENKGWGWNPVTKTPCPPLGT
jgi:hypothetical protein